MKYCTVFVLFVILFGSGSAFLRCEKITTKLCLNLGYNSTLMPNFMGHDTQKEADLMLGIYAPFLSHSCSPHIKLFICSMFVPMCSEHVPRPIPACKGLCEKVEKDCLSALEANGLTWPRELNCSRFPEETKLCMQEPTETILLPNYPNPSGIKYNISHCPPNTKPRGNKCVPLCKYKQLFQKEEVTTFEIWVAVWSIICLVFTVVALLTFLIQPRRFRWPARPILYLTSCGFVTSTIYLIRWLEGPYTCTGESQLEKPSESLSCVGISLILLFCDIAYSLWWCVFCFVWFLSAAKEWSTEAIEKISTRLHTSVWIFSAIPMLYILISNNININYLSGFCEVKNMPLIMFQLVFMVISMFLSVLTSVALKNVRKTLMAAGRSPLKLEILFYRLLIISVGICIPHLCYLLCQFYDTFSFALVKLVLRTVSIIFSTLWVYSPKTFKTWNDLLCSPFKRKVQNDSITEKKTIFKVLIPKIFQSRKDIPKIGVPLMPVTKV